jgi:hypothetical protein
MKKLIFILLTLISTCFYANAQTSSIGIFSVLNNRNTPQSPVPSSIATIQKEVIHKGATTPVEITPTIPTTPTKPIKSNIDLTKKAEIKSDYAIFELAGATSTVQLNTLQAKFGFDGKASDTSKIQLYKVEVKDGKRIFSVIAGKTLATRISINFLEKIPENIGSSRSDTRTNVNQVKFPNGYLPQGEYVFIDTATISADGTQLKCYAFTIL